VAITVNPLLALFDEYLATAGEAGWYGSAAPTPPFELVTPEALAYVTEQAASTDQVRAGRFERLRRAMAGLGLAAATRETRLKLNAFDATMVPMPSREWSLKEALAAIALTQETAARDELGRGLWPVAAQAQGHVRAVVDAAFGAAQARGASTIGQLLPDALAATRSKCADAVLVSTEDAYRDVMGFALKRIFSVPRPVSQARVADVLHTLHLAAVNSHFSATELHGVITRWLGELKWLPRGLAVDPARSALGALAAPIRPPAQVKLRLAPTDGANGWYDSLAATFEAVHHSSVEADLLLVDRRLGDDAVFHATGLWAASHLADAAWLVRYVGLSRNVARETARLVALRQLTSIRLTAAVAPICQDLAEKGLTNEVVGRAQERLARALGCEMPLGFVIRQLELFTAVQRFDALALAGSLHHHLVSRFDVDAFRNPAAGEVLVAHCALGQTFSPATRAKQLTANLEHGCELTLAVAPLIASLGA
jgi:hypothetical protein